MDWSRRDLGLGLGTVAMGAAVGRAGAAAPPAAAGDAGAAALAFPKDFLWGCATAAYQIEGAVGEDGRGATIWDGFAHSPGKIANGDTADIACDSYHRYRDDHRMLKDLGVGAYRMSIAWSRIFPEGRGQPNQKGIDHYDRVIDDLLAKGITPYLTLFHWDLPSALPGDWQNRDTAYAFADYAGFVAGRLGDRVRDFMTVNELRSFTDFGYNGWGYAPGLALPPAGLNQVRHHAVLAHGLGVQAIRAHAPAGTRVGLADNTAFHVPVIETEPHIAAAAKATREENAMFLTAILEGRYIDSYLAAEGRNAPVVQAGDMAAIGAPIDFVGLNVYYPHYVRADPAAPGYVVLPRLKSTPRMASPWLNVGPEVAYWAVRCVHDLWKPKAIYISENGCPADNVTAGGRFDDPDRIMYLRNHIGQFHRATREGLPLRGYFLWSLMDNFEWIEGFATRFGLYHVDYATQVRTPKLSADWYRELIRRNGLV